MKKINDTLKRQREFYKTGKTYDVNFRIEQLKKLKTEMIKNEIDLQDALKEDFGKCEFESYTSEIALIKSGIKQYEKHLKGWAREKGTPRTLATIQAKGKIRLEPYGQVLIMSPWNYPLQLALGPLIGAIAAGNTAILKPSRYAPNTVKVMKEMIERIFDDSYVAVFEGGREINQELFKERFDFIFFTGGTKVGKIVMQAAAKFLTPVALELGGKSPAIVDKTADIKKAAKAICWDKFTNAGQTCIAPDFVVAHSSIKDELISSMKNVIKEFYGDNPRESPDFARIITDRHFDRISDLIEDEKIISGGEKIAEERYIAPTILDNVSWDDDIMKEEIFGPVLPILTYDNTIDMIEHVTSYETPLALYIFSIDKEQIKNYIKYIPSGDVVVNDTLLHFANHHLPFGGKGHSGMGVYHGKHSYEAFSHKRSVMYRNMMIDNPLRYPPYKKKLKLIKKIL